jgi:hypothetical protein
MPTKTPAETAKTPHAGEPKARKPRDKGWDERLRHVGDARFVDVEWSGRDHPSWPLPKK